MIVGRNRGFVFEGVIFSLSVFAGLSNAFALPVTEYLTQVTAEAQVSPPRILLSWPANPHAINIKVYRKLLNDPAWGSPVATLAPSAVSYADNNVSVGAAFEYQLETLTDYFPYPNGDASQWLTAYGYIYAGIQVPLIENRGKVILLVDNSFSAALSNELARLQQDLAGDGWTVLRHDVSRSNSVPATKALIQADYNADPANVRSVFLFGHVPVPYSGSINPDGHADHKGAWPADVYYGDVDGVWPDTTVNDTSAQYSRNYNVPGDGKFDPSVPPSSVELEVGRVDLVNLPAFAPKTELDLLRQYLNKDHNFRVGSLPVERRGLVRDNFGDLTGEAPSASSWRNYAPLFGSNATTEVAAGTYFSTLQSRGYLWSYGAGGGTFNSASGVGFTSDFAANDPRTVFTMLFGSYFGDWDSQDNFLRAPLATTTYGLTCAWAGFPQWYFQHLALGQTIGFSARLTQNNQTTGLYRTKVNAHANEVHIALMGDPTLRLHPVLPPSSLTNSIPGAAALTWSASPEGVQGYHVYRAANPGGPFTRLTPSLIAGTSFTDPTAPSGSNTYLVRAVKLETSGSGTYLNPSQGIFLNLNVSPAPSSVPCAPGPPGLVGWWSGDGNAQDIQGTNHGMLLNGTSFAAGKVGLGFNFDGVDDIVQVGPQFANVTNNFTLLLWARPTAARGSTSEGQTGTEGLGGQRYAIFPTQGSIAYGLGHAGWGISVGTNGVSVFEHANNSIPSLLVYDAPLSGWTHIAVVCQNQTPLLYLNGVLKRTGVTSNSTTHPSADLSGEYGYFQGGLDEVAVCNRALAAAEIQSIASADSAGLCKFIQITSITRPAPGQAQLNFAGRTGIFGVESSTNFINWTQIGTITNVTGSVSFLDPSAGISTRRFYRAVQR